MAIVIRLATAGDAARLAAVAERTFRETFSAQNAREDMDLHCAQAFGEEIQRREIIDPRLVTLLAEVGADLVGFAQLRLASSTSCVRRETPSELNRIYVTQEWHGRRVARELMAAVFRAADQASADCIWLGVWERNSRAMAFYEKLGFAVVGEHTFQLGRDSQRDLIMALDMDQLPPGKSPVPADTRDPD